MNDLPHIIMRLEAPLMSFGTTIVDKLGYTQEHPALSMITGLIGNSLGYDHSDYKKLARLQERITYAVRRDVKGRRIRDYQTVDLSQDYLDHKRCGWTTRGRIDVRRGNTTGKSGKHQRFRDYWADSVFMVAVGLFPMSEKPHITDIRKALIRPSRPLYIGRKCCLPSAPIYHSLEYGMSPLAAMSKVPIAARWSGSNDKKPLEADSVGLRTWWDRGDPYESNIKVYGSRIFTITDERDWHNQIHGGRRMVCDGIIMYGGTDGASAA